MPKYFTYFPQTLYNVDETKKNVDVVTNITTKFGFESTFKENTAVYYNYIITDGETPEMLAHKFYNDAEKHWVLLTLNDIYSPMNDWPMEQRSLYRYIDTKYSDVADTANTSITGLQWARTNNHSYYKIESQTVISTGDKTTTKYQIDANTYANVVSSTSNYTLGDGSIIKIETSKDVKTYLDYEIDVNDEKRKIKILKPEFVGAVDQELRKLFE